MNEVLIFSSNGVRVRTSLVSYSAMCKHNIIQTSLTCANCTTATSIGGEPSRVMKHNTWGH